MMKDYYEILDFWFEELEPDDWFRKDSKLDDKIRNKFEHVYNDITCGRYNHLMNSPKGTLAIIIVLDRFSRNMFRDTEKMFSFDLMALKLTKHAIKNKFDKELEPIERLFLYMPFMNSEELEHQNKCIKLFEKLAKEEKEIESNLNLVKKNISIIERFGRFPHRNEVLERPSTQEEIKFLKQFRTGFPI